MTTVCIITWCQDINALYGSTLVFRSIRTAFPTAPIMVVDNGSLEPCREGFRSLAEAVGGDYVQLPEAISHHDLLLEVIRTTRGRLVFVDPDIHFWECVEDWPFDSLLSGRMIPAFQCPFSRAWTHARLHTSFLRIADAEDLTDRLVSQFTERRGEDLLLAPVQLRIGEAWHRWDTFALVTESLGHECLGFGPQQLDAYEHLFSGSHLEIGLCKMNAEQVWNAQHWVSSHAAVKAGHLPERGLWKKQQEWFRERAGSDPQGGLAASLKTDHGQMDIQMIGGLPFGVNLENDGDAGSLRSLYRKAFQWCRENGHHRLYGTVNSGNRALQSFYENRGEEVARVYAVNVPGETQEACAA